jgi:glycyl-tRNA synthetase beta chain
LSDARFFYVEDQKKTLEARLEDLKNVLFQKGLGSTFEKVERTRDLAAYLCDALRIPSQHAATINAAVKLSKCDLLTSMVYEFPELQGIMGRIYALLEGQDALLATALEEQYAVGVPESVEGAVLSLSDKMDVLCGNLWLGNLPSGSKDPYGLRKKLYQICDTMVQYHWEFSLKDFFEKGLIPFRERLNMKQPHKGEHGNEEASNLVQAFREMVQSRLEFLLRGRGVSYDVIRAVQHHWAYPLKAVIAAESINDFKGDAAFIQVATLFERVHNISKNHESKDFDSRLFEEEAEKALLIRFTEVKEIVLDHVRHLNFKEALVGLMQLKECINRYFEEVFVMVDRDDLRLTRLGFLKNIDELFMTVADISFIEKENDIESATEVNEKQKPDERGLPNVE